MHLTYAALETPIGVGVAVCSDVGLRSLTFADVPPTGILHTPDGPAVPSVEPALDSVLRQLSEYFAAERRDFEVPLDLRGITGFTRAALEAITQIPYGQTASYGEIAITVGSPGAARAVGTACAQTPISVVIPVHRVVRADGSPGEYGGRAEAKRLLLTLEDAPAPHP